MSWSRNFGLDPIFSDVLSLQLRAQRLQLLQRVEAVRAQALATGVSNDTLKAIQSKVLSYALPLTSPTKTPLHSRGALRNLSVESEDFV